jgi:AcrR family transcriptional regulator
MSPRVSADQREEYLQERREEILDAAVEAFGRKGFSGTSVSDIARAAGIAKGTIYLYFGSKEEIFGAILTERSFVPQLAHLPEDGPASLEEALRTIAEDYLAFMKDHYPIFRMVLADAHKFPAHLEEVYREVILEANRLVAARLAAESESGRIRPQADPFLTARAFWGMLIVYVVTQHILGGQYFTPIDRKVWVEEVIRLFLDGVQP